MLNIVLDVVEPRSLALTEVLSKHADSDVGILTLLNVGRAGEHDLRTSPVSGIGVGLKGETTLNRLGVAGNGPANIDTALLADLDGVADGAHVDSGEGWGRKGDSENAGGKDGGVDEEFGKHVERRMDISWGKRLLKTAEGARRRC